jgi:hypothetical protein
MKTENTSWTKKHHMKIILICGVVVPLVLVAHGLLTGGRLF